MGGWNRSIEAPAASGLTQPSRWRVSRPALSLAGRFKFSRGSGNPVVFGRAPSQQPSCPFNRPNFLALRISSCHLCVEPRWVSAELTFSIETVDYYVNIVMVDDLRLDWNLNWQPRLIISWLNFCDWSSDPLSIFLFRIHYRQHLVIATEGIKDIFLSSFEKREIHFCTNLWLKLTFGNGI